uniref:Uncharacterized protein n=1 Tax=Clytia hemisphaerica TaxID=252671 RepID=A0A7M5WSA2_9CNID
MATLRYYVLNYEPNEQIFDFIKRILVEESSALANIDSIKQTFVYVRLSHKTEYPLLQSDSYKMLRKLQDDKNWAVIIFCVKDLCPSKMWMPLQHLIFLDDTPSKLIRHQNLADLANLIKNPDYNRYQFYQSLPMSKHLFDETCLKDIKKVHIGIGIFNDAYIPPAMWVTNNVNKRRERLNKEPLEIIFYLNIYRYPPNMYTLLIEKLPFHIRFTYNYEGSLARSNTKENFYARVVDDSDGYCLFPQDCNQPNEMLCKLDGVVECSFINKIVKSFDELFELISRDICSKN